MNNNPTQLLHDALDANARGMYALAAAKARRAATLLQASADQLRHEVRCLQACAPRIEFKPLDADDQLGELTIDDLPRYLRRQAE